MNKQTQALGGTYGLVAVGIIALMIATRGVWYAATVIGAVLVISMAIIAWVSWIDSLEE